MPLLQIYLKAGKQEIVLPSKIDRSSFKIRDIQAHFNIANHGFYLAKVYFSFLPVNNAINNLSLNKYVTFGLDHVNPYTTQILDYDVGTFEIPRAFQVFVDLDNGLQIVPSAKTVSGQTYSFQPFDKPNVTQDFVYPSQVGSYSMVSLGLLSDAVINGTIGTDATNGANPGKIQGATPFLYSFILTFEVTFYIIFIMLKCFI